MSRSTGLLTVLRVLALLVGPDVAEAREERRGVPTVGILMFDGVQIIDFAAPYEVFGQARFDVSTVSRDGRPITTAMGLAVAPDYAFDNAPAFDVLVVPGGDIAKAARDRRTLEWLVGRAAEAEHVLSVCTGSYVLGHAGLLDGLEATTFHRALDDMAETFPAISVVRDQRYVDSGQIVTSAGLSSGVDAALHVVAQVRSMDSARTIAMHLEYDWRPDDGFVRGRLADRWIDRPEIDWPRGTDVQRQVAFGDETSWHERHRVTTNAPPARVLEALRSAYREVEHWPEPEQNADRLSWRRNLGDGRLATLTARVENLGDRGFDLVVDLDLKEAPPCG